jgi:hypothetical protein
MAVAVITSVAGLLLNQFQTGSDAAKTTTGSRITTDKEKHRVVRTSEPMTMCGAARVHTA